MRVRVSPSGQRRGRLAAGAEPQTLAGTRPSILDGRFRYLVRSVRVLVSVVRTDTWSQVATSFPISLHFPYRFAVDCCRSVVLLQSGRLYFAGPGDVTMIPSRGR